LIEIVGNSHHCAVGELWFASIETAHLCAAFLGFFNAAVDMFETGIV
jgi:hypothetical protein